MRYLPGVTFLLWLALIGGYKFAGNFILQPMVKFPAVVLLSIFIPVSFWILRQKGRKLQALAIIALFVFNCAVLTSTVFHNYQSFQSLSFAMTGIDPDVARILSTGESENERRLAGKSIFQKFAVSVPYKTSGNQFVSYVPTGEDRSVYFDNIDRNHQLNSAKRNLGYEIITSFFLLGLQVAIFIGVLVYLILFDKPMPREEREVRAKV